MTSVRLKHSHDTLKQGCQILFLEGHYLAKLSLKSNQTNLNQITKFFRISRNFRASVLGLVGAKLCRIRIGHPSFKKYYWFSLREIKHFKSMQIVAAPCIGWFVISVTRTQIWESWERSTFAKPVRFEDSIVTLNENQPADTAPG